MYIKSYIKKKSLKEVKEEKITIVEEKDIEMHVGYVVPLYIELKTIEDKCKQLLKDKNVTVDSSDDYFIVDDFLFDKSNCNKYELDYYEHSDIQVISCEKINTRIVFNSKNKNSKKQFIKIFTKLLIRDYEWQFTKSQTKSLNV